MKKLVFLLLILFQSTCYAGTITLNTISSDSTTSTFNSNFTTLANLVNGALEGSADGGSTVANIDNDTVYEINMADNANPRVYANETLGIGTDTVSGSTLDQDSYVYSGGIPADDTDLTSDISACVAYINGHRVSKSATAQTYIASRDGYVDLSQSGVYTLSSVTNGAAAPAVAANSARIAKVVTNGTEITSVTDLAQRSLPALLVPTNYRSGMTLSRDSTTAIIVAPGVVEINSTLVNTTTATTLGIGTAGDWAGGSSLRATSTYGYVGIDDDGNIKMHTTAPTHDNYAVSSTAGKKRYATWSSTVYRILGWFYMNATGSGELNQWGVSNISEMGVPNVVQRNDSTADTINDTSYGSDLTNTSVQFYTSGGQVRIMAGISGDTATVGAQDGFECILNDGDDIPASARTQGTGSGGDASVYPDHLTMYAQGTKTFSVRAKVSANAITSARKTVTVQEF